ncbi:ATP-binding protein [Streptomyces sp. NBC_01176]|uniref:ATP-binding protein n=1 Tax=Streptomyces sp. NBC_01176 TaxID=2903760 RepID=UPI003868BE72|nr:ATP-binding protein [Streptomyces sp. NBC_01176]
MARTLVRIALAAWHQEELVDDALNVITELVSHAVAYARLPSIRIIVARPRENRVRLGVVDRSRTVPQLRSDANGDQIHGRALVVVDALADRWGTDIHPWGKTVWVELKVEPAS